MTKHAFFYRKKLAIFLKNTLLFLKRKPKSGMIKCKAKFKKINVSRPFAAAFSK